MATVSDTAARLRTALATLRWSGRLLAGLFGYDEKQVRRWLAGAAVAPAPIVTWLETLAAFHSANPPPSDS